MWDSNSTSKGSDTYMPLVGVHRTSGVLGVSVGGREDPWVAHAVVCSTGNMTSGALHAPGDIVSLVLRHLKWFCLRMRTN